MYLDFFELTEAPFNCTLDPKFFYASPQHDEALASLLYAVTQRKGLIVLTGCTGSGKSFLGRVLCEHLGSNALVAQMSASEIEGTDLLDAVLGEFEAPVAEGLTVRQRLVYLQQFLVSVVSKGRLALLILDDAQALSEAQLEALRLLNNLEGQESKLLQIVMLGQPSLQHLLNQKSFEQFRQRVFRAFHIAQFTRDVTHDYIRFRLQIAGSTSPDLIPAEAVHVIQQCTHGVPRVINQLCDNLLLSAYADKATVIGPERVSRVVNELQLPSAGSGVQLAAGHAPHTVTDGNHPVLNGAESSPIQSTVETGESSFEELQNFSDRLVGQEQRPLDQETQVEHQLTELAKSASAFHRREQESAEVAAQLLKQVGDAKDLLSSLASQRQYSPDEFKAAAEQMTAYRKALTEQLERGKESVRGECDKAKELISRLESEGGAWPERVALVEERLCQLDHAQERLSETNTGLLSTASKVRAQATEKIDRLSSQMMASKLSAAELLDARDAVRPVLEEIQGLLRKPLQLKEQARESLEVLERLQTDSSTVEGQLSAALERAAQALQRMAEENEHSARQDSLRQRQLSEAADLTTALKAGVAEALAAQSRLLEDSREQLASELSAQLAAARGRLFEDNDVLATKLEGRLSEAAQVTTVLESRVAEAMAGQDRVLEESREQLASELSAQLAAARGRLFEDNDVLATKLEGRLSEAAQVTTVLESRIAEAMAGQDRLLEESREQLASELRAQLAAAQGRLSENSEVLATELEGRLSTVQTRLLHKGEEQFKALFEQSDAQLRETIETREAHEQALREHSDALAGGLKNQLTELQSRLLEAGQQHVKGAAANLDAHWLEGRKKQEAYTADLTKRNAAMMLTMKKRMIKVQKGVLKRGERRSTELGHRLDAEISRIAEGQEQVLSDLARQVERIEAQIKAQDAAANDIQRAFLTRLEREGQAVIGSFRAQMIGTQQEVLREGQRQLDTLATRANRLLSEAVKAQDQVLGRLASTAEARTVRFRSEMADVKQTYDKMLRSLPQELEVGVTRIAEDLQSVGPFFRESVVEIDTTPPKTCPSG